MSFLSQSNRTAVLTTPLGSDDLVVQSVEGVDEISQLFAYDLTLLADASNDINFSSILGKSISLSFDDGSGTLRYISGISTQFSQAEQVGASQSLPALCRYRMRMQPKLWTLGLTTNCMIYENRTPAQVIESVLKNASIEYSLRLSNPSAKRVYIVQFNETDLDFISRHMEEEGLSYYFKFAKGSAEVFQSRSSGGSDGRGPAVNLANAVDQSSGYGECELPPSRVKDIGFVALSGSFQDGQQPDPEHPTANLNLWSGGVNSSSRNDTEKVALGLGNSTPRIRRLEVG